MEEKLSKYEQETIIIFNKGEAMAEVFTYEKSWQRHIVKRLGIQPCEDNGFGGRFYEVPKTMIRPPRAPKKLSDKTKVKLAEQAKAMARDRYNQPHK